MSIKHFMEALLGLLYPQERFCLCCKGPITEDFSKPHWAPPPPTDSTPPPTDSTWPPTDSTPPPTSSATSLSLTWPKTTAQFVEETGLCEQCRNQMRPIQPPYCLLCGRNITNLQPTALSNSASVHASQFPLRCPECERGTSYVLSRSYGAYQGALRDLLHRYKFSKERELIQLLGPFLCEAWDRHLAHFSADILVPVPAHPDRLKERGFNPAELLSRDLCRYSKIPSVELLQRAVHLQGQATRYREERLEALKGAYIINPAYRNQAVGKRIILVDDIYTTGSTAEACGQSLMEAGAVQVYVLTVAR